MTSRRRHVSDLIGLEAEPQTSRDDCAVVNINLQLVRKLTTSQLYGAKDQNTMLVD